MVISENAFNKLLCEAILKHINENFQNELTAYHGCLADFDKFDLKFIGTGEGTQEYGNGVYVTAVESTGKMYGIIVNYKRNKQMLKASKDEYYKMYNRFYDVAKNALKRLHNPKDSNIAPALKMAFEYKIEKSVKPDTKKAYMEEYNKICGNVSDASEMRIGKPVETIKDYKILLRTYVELCTKNLDPPMLYRLEIPDDGYIDWNNKDKNFIDYMFKTICENTGCNISRNKFKTFGEMFFYVTGSYEKYKEEGATYADKEDLRKLFMKMGYNGIMMPTGNNSGGDGFGMNYVVFDPENVKILSKGKAI